MSTSIEEVLRQDLAAAADHVDIPLDLDAVIGDGSTALRRRTRRRTALAGSLAAVTLVGGGVALQAVRGDDPTPASVPTSAPSAVPTNLVGTAVTAEGMESVPGEPAQVRLAVTAVEADGAVRFRVTGQDAAGKAVGSASEVVLPAGRPSVTFRPRTVCHVCVVHVVRGEATAFGSVRREGARSHDDPAEGWAGSGALPWGQGALTAYVEWETMPPSGKRPTGRQFDDIVGLQWRTPDWQVRNSLGDRVPTARFTLDGKPSVVFVDKALDTFGLWAEDGSATTAVEGAWQTGGMVEGGTGHVRTTGLLPAGSTVTGAVWEKHLQPTIQQQDLPGVGTAYLVSARTTGDSLPHLTSLTYRRADGKVVTVRPKG